MKKKEQPAEKKVYTLEEIFTNFKDDLINISLWMDSMRRSTIDSDEKLIDSLYLSNPNYEEIFGDDHFFFLIEFTSWMDTKRRTTVRTDSQLVDDYYKFNILSKVEKPEFEKIDKNSAQISSETITITKEELRTFYEDVAGEQTGWSESSYRLAKFIGIDPTQGT